jgi:hypothetical protein
MGGVVKRERRAREGPQRQYRAIGYEVLLCKSRRDCPEAGIRQFVSRQKKMLQ